MAEMRRPMDFWKGMVNSFSSVLSSIQLSDLLRLSKTLAQLLIFVAYLLYGCFIYVRDHTSADAAGYKLTW